MLSRFIRTLVALLLLMGLQACKPKNVIASTTNPRLFTVNFELKTNPVWRVPERGLETEVYLALEMTNRGPGSIRFPIMDSFQLSIENPDGVVRAMEGGMDGLRPGKPVSDPVAPDGKYMLRLSAQISRGADNHPRLRIEDTFGGIWWIDQLDAGTNLLHMNYESQHVAEGKDKDIWIGRAVIAPVSIQIITH